MRKYTRHSADTILAMRGKAKSPEAIARMAAAQRARQAREHKINPYPKHTIEARLRMLDRKFSPETRARMSAAQAKRRAGEKETKDMGIL